MKGFQMPALGALVLAATLSLMALAWHGYSAVGWRLLLDGFPLCG